MDHVIKTFFGIVKGVNVDNYTVDVVCSDETVDRYHEVVLADAWKSGLKDFKKHPILLSSHAYGDLRKQIGEIQNIRVSSESKELIATCKYYVGEGNPEADWGWKIAQKGRAAYSVGFRAKEYEELSWEDWQKDTSKPRRTYTQVELLELSHVIVPANPSALQKAVELGDYAKSIQDLIEEDPSLGNAFEEAEEKEVVSEKVEDVVDTEVKSELLESPKELFVGTIKLDVGCLESLIKDLKAVVQEVNDGIGELKKMQTEVTLPSKVEETEQKEVEEKAENQPSYVDNLFEETEEKKNLDVMLAKIRANTAKLNESFGTGE